MKDKLELKHLACYLPYSLKVVMEGKKTNVAWMSTKNIAVIIPNGVGEYKKIPWKRAHHNIKPILRPLSDLNDEEGEINTPESLQGCCYSYVNTLISKHYDIFGLIEKGLAIDIKTLKQ